jgi:hypothetical protein
MQIRSSAMQDQNVEFSKRRSLEGGANVTTARPQEQRKHSGPIPSTDEGMQVDVSEEQFPNAARSIRES